MADIPGIIGGASEGRGLGFEFLRHIERTSNLLFMLDIANYRTLEEQFDTLQHELKNYSDILSTRSYAIALTRIDALTPEECLEKSEAFIKHLGLEVKERNNYPFAESNEASMPRFVIPISSVARENTKELVHLLYGQITQ